MDLTVRQLNKLNKKDLSIFCSNAKKERKKYFYFIYYGQ